MSRVQVLAWTWQCDQCRIREELAFRQSGLLGLIGPDIMRARGWSISEGRPVRDLCPRCAADRARP